MIDRNFFEKLIGDAVKDSFAANTFFANLVTRPLLPDQTNGDSLSFSRLQYLDACSKAEDKRLTVFEDVSMPPPSMSNFESSTPKTAGIRHMVYEHTNNLFNGNFNVSHESDAVNHHSNNTAAGQRHSGLHSKPPVANLYCSPSIPPPPPSSPPATSSLISCFRDDYPVGKGEDMSISSSSSSTSSFRRRRSGSSDTDVDDEPCQKSPGHHVVKSAVSVVSQRPRRRNVKRCESSDEDQRSPSYHSRHRKHGSRRRSRTPKRSKRQASPSEEEHYRRIVYGNHENDTNYYGHGHDRDRRRFSRHSDRAGYNHRNTSRPTTPTRSVLNLTDTSHYFDTTIQNTTISRRPHSPVQFYPSSNNIYLNNTFSGSSLNLSGIPAHSSLPDGFVDERAKYTYFFTKKYPFSNHYPAIFKLQDQTYLCTEQYYMYQKAKCFNDETCMLDIMATNDPKVMKNLGRKVNGFIQSRWDGVSVDHMMTANYAKYTQNRDLRLALFTTEGTVLVETNPTDFTWGIGLSMDDWRAWNSQTWRGKNLLGQILTQIRDDIMQQSQYADEILMVRADRSQFVFWNN